MRLKDNVTGDITEGYQFDGQDEGGTLRNALRNKVSVEQDEIVVGSWRLYLPQRVPSLDPDGGYDQLTEIVERYNWVIWDEGDLQWVIYPDKLKRKFFTEVPDGDA